jgi:hypothetical protein
MQMHERQATYEHESSLNTRRFWMLLYALSGTHVEAKHETNEFSILNLSDIKSNQFELIRHQLRKGWQIKITINSKDYNKKRIGATQDFFCEEKWKRSNSYINDNPTGILSIRTNSKGLPVCEVFITDGHHRTARSLLEGQPIIVNITNTVNRINNEVFPIEVTTLKGFNVFMSKVKRIFKEFDLEEVS